ncbi:MAG: hypothetical protein HKO02_09045 [Hyphomonadaceae bacterium]|nr:hypothetical protein [Hyphomonadaceae bacterium]
METVPYPIGENHPDPTLLFSIDRKHLKWMNGAAESWLRKPKSALIGQCISEFGRGFDELKTHINQLGNEDSTSYRGHDIIVNVRRIDFVCSFNIYNSAAGIVVQISPKEMGSGFVHATGPDQSVSMLGRMLAHELKNPLAGIKGAAQLLEVELENPDDLELTGLISTEVDRIGRLADRMEKFGQADFDNYTHFNVHEVLQKTFLIFVNQGLEDIEFVELFDPSLPDVFGDSDGIMQVLINLLANAVDAIKSVETHGVIKVETRFRTGIHRLDQTGRKHALPVEVRIIDNGPGIPEALRDRVFQPFVTGKSNGQGLGLALISKIIADHGGLIEVSSEPGQTEFSILLPVEPQADKG